MILVIQKMFRVLELLSGGREISIKQLALDTGFDKGSLCNLLKTTVDLGYLEKPSAGRYRLSRKFANLTRNISTQEQIAEAANKIVRRLAARTEESGVLSTLQGGGIVVLAQAQHPRRVMLRISNYEDLSLYGSVSGRVLLSHLGKDLLLALVEEVGPPKETDWPMVTSPAKLYRELGRLKTSRVVTTENPDLEASSLGVAIKDSEESVCAALALSIPVFRMTSKKRQLMVSALEESAKEMEEVIKTRNWNQSDFFQNFRFPEWEHDENNNQKEG